MKLKYLLMTVCLSYGTVEAQETVKGIVFEDTNQNGKKDKNETGVSNVGVSNGRDVVLTNAKGEYQLPTAAQDIIFVIKPTNYRFSYDTNNLPKFYYTHKPQGGPQVKYMTSPPSGKLPASLDFPLYRNMEENNFKILVFGDPQAYTQAELNYFKKGIIDDISNPKQYAFGVSLGDLVGDDLSLHPKYKAVVSQLGIPWYNVMGNHDMNYDVTVDSLSDETFEFNFGPNTYSFNQGNAHFIILDNILYPNPRNGKGYLGGFRKDQLDFIENDLKFVPKDKLIVLCFHIPLEHNNSDVFRNEDRQRLFDLLSPFKHTVSLSAHTHFQKQNFYTKKDGWQQDTPHHEFNVGTTSGDWYSGVLNTQNVPTSTMRDGTPRGYAIMNIKDNNYSFDYKVAGEEENYQINIIVPKAIQSNYLKQYTIYANFFMGKKDDEVLWRIDNGDWKRMKFEEIIDPSYQFEVGKFDNTVELIPARRPSNPVNSQHIWTSRLPKNLAVGRHTIEVQATDMYGKTHKQHVDIEVVQ